MCQDIGQAVTDTGLDLRLTTGQPAQQLEFVVCALVRLGVHKHRSRPATLRDEDGLMGGGGPLDDTGGILA